MAAPQRRFTHEPGFVLHSYDWSETSLILEVLTRHQGRVALVAKGAKRPSSNFRPVLLPLQALSLSWTQGLSNTEEIHPLKGAEWVGGYPMPRGEALLAGTYLNELLLRLLARGDPHTALYDAYAAVVPALSQAQDAALEPLLRSFELVLLQSLGLLPELDRETPTQQPLKARLRYVLRPENGLCVATSEERAGMLGKDWMALHLALRAVPALPSVLSVCAHCASALKHQLRLVLQYHCGHPMLRTRQLMMDLQNL